MTELWQLYDEQGRAITDKGSKDDDIYSKGLLHGSSHVWLWRQTDGRIEILLQKRASDKKTCPNLLDTSAAGHIDLGESPIEAALRESKEELGIDINQTSLVCTGLYRRLLVVPNSTSIENEFCWLYTVKAETNVDVSLLDGEVDSILWKNLDTMKQEYDNADLYVPHGKTYYSIIFEAIERQATELLS